MGLGIGFCCCGCATCGGILDDPTLAVLGGSRIPVAGLFDIFPTTTNYATHAIQFAEAKLVYQAALSTATVHVLSGVTSGSTFRVTLRLQDGTAPTVSMVQTAGLTAPAVSADYISSLGGLFGAVWYCDDTESGWTQIEHANTGGRFFQMTKFEGVYIVTDAGTGSPAEVMALPIPMSWCCPNGNSNANGDGNCGEVDTLPATCDVTIAGFTDALPNRPWTGLNGTFTLSKTFQSVNATYVRATYLLAQTISGTVLNFSASIVAPRPGVDTAQCSAAISITVTGGSIATGTVWFGLPSGSDKSLRWRWMPLGCQFGYGGTAASGAAVADYGRPTLLAW